jgi:hypothetical protein
LKQVFVEGKMITVDTGKKLLDWSKGVVKTTAEPPAPPEELITLEQQTTITGIVIDKNVDKAAFLKFMGANAISEIKAIDYQKAIDSLKLAKGKKAA